jgi:hypothetical protein
MYVMLMYCTFVGMIMTIHETGLQSLGFLLQILQTVSNFFSIKGSGD